MSHFTTVSSSDGAWKDPPVPPALFNKAMTNILEGKIKVVEILSFQILIYCPGSRAMDMRYFINKDSQLC